MNRILIGQLADKQKNLTEQWIKSDNLLFVFLNAAETAERYPNTITGADLARLLNILARAEIKEGGPYRSFTDSRDGDVDIGANIAIAYFLSLQGVDLPALNKLIEKAIVNNDFKSKFFASEQPVVYLLAKFYNGKQKQSVIDSLSGISCNDDLDRKLASASLALLKRNQEKVSDGFNSEEERIIGMIRKMAREKFSRLGKDFRETAMREFENTIEGNPDKQMSLMAYYMKLALGAKGREIPDEMAAKMGLANIFFWSAFIIYDNFWDCDEEAKPSVLPVANLFARHYTDFFGSLCDKEFNGLFHQLMDKLDAANNWETLYCRTKVENSVFTIPETLPVYGDYALKYQPSSGHILGPVAMLFMIGFHADSAEVHHLTEYFRNYLIAMQINDDAHDWLEDMQRGHLSTVVMMLLEDWRQDYPGIKKIDLQADLEKLQRLFWFKTIKRASQTVLDYTGKSRHALRSLKIIENFEPLERYTVLNENVAKKALAEQEMSIEFLKEFN